ncbi:N-acetylmuramoyl-L-alanine amidase [Hymenobacter gelipurpurascens]|uniref:N-acetylmuramoyl-L-alanine amidase n=1 Tax=Hymenobacter gelipurpurascens TaxID=89968 RepID=A0A212T154_9BACT|nr:N-acetylmuramoyl-L-alanine amidase [Hymenobacter gelipurpurascens]SNC59757.1 N-acetylmuramoyl-L-alanine amidase [Hymenobacter gelipurpurascens]
MRTAALLVLLFLFSTQAFSQSSYRRAVAKPGDGYQTLLLRHGLSPSRHLRQFQELNKKRLGRNKTLVVGRAYLLPNVGSATKKKPAARTTAATPATSKKPIPLSQLFGGQYGAPQVRDRALGGAVYYLSSGHGGPDPGAIGQYGSAKLSEDEYAYDVTVRLARVLLEHGATVYVMVQDPNDGIRDENVLKLDHDEMTYPQQRIPLSQLGRLRQRISEVNRLHARHKGAYQRLLALHVDSRSEGQNIDVFFYHHANSATGLRLAKNIHSVFTNRYKRAQPNRPYSGNVSERSSLYEVRNSHAPAVFMELGNIRNQKDQRRFLVADNRQALANWIYEGLLADYRGR